MNVDCPYCHASSVCESTDNTVEQAVDQVDISTVIENAARELFQSIGLHPLIKVVLSMTLIVAVQYLKSNHGSLPFAQMPYRCEDCNRVFTVFYPFV